MQVKLKDWGVGEIMAAYPYSRNKCEELEQMILDKIQPSLPENAVVVHISVAVEVHCARKPEEDFPFDMESFQYRVNIQQRGHADIVEAPSSTEKKE